MRTYLLTLAFPIFASLYAMAETTTVDKAPCGSLSDATEVENVEPASGETEQSLIPRIQDPEVLHILTCVQNEIPILESQKIAAQHEVAAVIEEMRLEFDAQKEFLKSLISSSSPERAKVFKTLLKDVKRKKTKSQSSFLGIMWKLGNAEILVEDENTNQ